MCRMRACPQCGAMMFDDMSLCYECLCDTSAEDADELATDTFVEDGADAKDEGRPRWTVRVKTHDVTVCVPLPPSGLTVGRGSSCDVVLHEPSVSRSHLHIVPRGTDVIVSDLGSKNHAVLDGQPIDRDMTWHAKQLISICGTTFALVDGPNV